MGLSGASERLRFHGWVAWVAGILSGMLGGLVGNQGGIRSAAMLGFDVPRQAFVATATAVGLIVDGARMPVYFFSMGHELVSLWPSLMVAVGGCLLGTVAGERLLRRIPEPIYRRLIGALILALGVYMLVRDA
jgi:uncharacterized protein